MSLYTRQKPPIQEQRQDRGIKGAPQHTDKKANKSNNEFKYFQIKLIARVHLNKQAKLEANRNVSSISRSTEALRCTITLQRTIHARVNFAKAGRN